MFFNSATFLVFFILFFLLYWWINRKFNPTIRNIFIIVASYIFYGWWDWRFLGLIALSSLVDYSIGRQLAKQADANKRKLLLLISVISNIGILGFFKYFNFFTEGLINIFSLFNVPLSTSTLYIILPVGISFYTFQTLSYTIDVYFKKIEPTKDAVSFFAFVCFFPQLVAGPIERAGRLLPQFKDKKTFQLNEITNGLKLVLWGLFKKVVIADNFGALADVFFGLSESYSGLNTLIGAFCFAIQIYADFSGYSDIAIGVSNMLGFKLMQNFKTPYFSKSMNEFWTRWHISLSQWFRDYVYIPLGGNRTLAYRVSINIMITFILSGLWHGASITFLIWGGLHGLALLFDKMIPKNTNATLHGLFVFVIVVLLWIPFRAENMTHLLQLSKSIVDVGSYSLSESSEVFRSYSLSRSIVLALVFLAFMMTEKSMNQVQFSQWINSKSKWMRWLSYYVLFIAIILMGNFDVKPSFIYFQF
jgi:alginate O-acetyltransferase complex protein AlgI